MYNCLTWSGSGHSQLRWPSLKEEDFFWKRRNAPKQDLKLRSNHPDSWLLDVLYLIPYSYMKVSCNGGGEVVLQMLIITLARESQLHLFDSSLEMCSHTQTNHNHSELIFWIQMIKYKYKIDQEERQYYTFGVIDIAGKLQQKSPLYLLCCIKQIFLREQVSRIHWFLDILETKVGFIMYNVQCTWRGINSNGSTFFMWYLS